MFEADDLAYNVGNASALEVAAELGESFSMLVEESKELVRDFVDEGDHDLAEVPLEGLVVYMRPL